MNQETVNELNAPIPGQSLTQDPENPQPWETPPEITDVQEAQELLFNQITAPDRIGSLLTILNEGIPVSKVATMAVKQGVFEGRWTPDLMLLLIEPTALMMVAIAKEFGVEPVVVDEAIREAMVSDLDIMRELGGIPEESMEIGEEMAGLMSPEIGEEINA